MKTVPLFIALLVAGCDAPCSNRFLHESASPDGKYVASIFERNCGATTPYVRVVSLREVSSKFDPARNEDWVFTVHGRANIRLTWVDKSELKISSSFTGDAPTHRAKWRDVKIIY